MKAKKMTATVLPIDDSISFEIGKSYLIVKQVRNRNDEAANGSNNVGSWVVKGCNVEGVGQECNDLAYLLDAFKKSVSR